MRLRTDLGKKSATYRAVPATCVDFEWFDFHAAKVKKLVVKVLAFAIVRRNAPFWGAPGKLFLPLKTHTNATNNSQEEQ